MGFRLNNVTWVGIFKHYFIKKKLTQNVIREVKLQFLHFRENFRENFRYFRQFSYRNFFRQNAKMKIFLSTLVLELKELVLSKVRNSYYNTVIVSFSSTRALCCSANFCNVKFLRYFFRLFTPH
jgi:hypothetical protein